MPERVTAETSSARCERSREPLRGRCTTAARRRGARSRTRSAVASSSSPRGAALGAHRGGEVRDAPIARTAAGDRCSPGSTRAWPASRRPESDVRSRRHPSTRANAHGNRSRDGPRRLGRPLHACRDASGRRSPTLRSRRIARRPRRSVARNAGGECRASDRGRRPSRPGAVPGGGRGCASRSGSSTRPIVSAAEHVGFAGRGDSPSGDQLATGRGAASGSSRKNSKVPYGRSTLPRRMSAVL